MGQQRPNIRQPCGTPLLKSLFSGLIWDSRNFEVPHVKLFSDNFIVLHVKNVKFYIHGIDISLK